ncbi:amino acid ABC transporter ATP-binding protein [Faecalicatena sp. AGMB00832]|uniref:Amino acid ABC transporter ATP-binding protein n=1 Tax=Faecalicatena faecalis TaxID=2726362 RepID=A0ABS6DB41_9FIRM|nr:amino acid ABC transporter ATP-binding protein [Faecalicatena faecalis]MBU3878676.1 amino acid ABC transporter ATP-binding protein [Faecalicatena faecalis]
MIEIKNLTKKFDQQEVLKDIDLKIEKGKVFVIIGPSGTGKSTLLRCINMLEKPDKGSIRLEDFEADFTNITKKQIQTLRSRTSMVFQNSNLYRNKTALENITTPLILVKKMNRTEAEKIGMELLNRVGMLEKKDSYPETLSGGERQRVGIARAMGMEPDIILFDEPTSALDPELVGEVLEVIKNLAAQHTTMLIVTHEMKFARNVADQIVFMEKGHIVEMAPPEEFFEHPKQERTRQFINRQVQ